MEESIDFFQCNGQISLIKITIKKFKKYHNKELRLCFKKKNYFKILFETRASYYYCINDCESNLCNCKDKDWIKGVWNGLLLYNCEDELLSINIFNYLKNNFNSINNLDRYELSLWLKSNLELFINNYYLEEVYILRIIVKYLFYIGIFNIYFYQKVRRLFFNKYKKILTSKLSYSNEYIEIEFEDKRTILIDNNYTNNTLQKKSLQSIESIICLYNHYILNTKKKIITINNDIGIINSMEIIYLQMYIDIFYIYKNLSDNYVSFFSNTMFEKKSIDLFLQKNKIDIKYKSILYNFIEKLSENISNKIVNIESTWMYMCDKLY